MSAARPLSVLIVDDDPDTAEALADLLVVHGYTVLCARSRGEALELASVATPDVALVGLGLPDGLGYDLAGELAVLPGGPPVLVALIGYDEDPRHSARAGVPYHFLKGTDPFELLAFLWTCHPALTPR